MKSDKKCLLKFVKKIVYNFIEIKETSGAIFNQNKIKFTVNEFNYDIFCNLTLFFF